MDSSVTFMFNFVLTVVGAFAFGYKAVEYSIDVPNVSLVSSIHDPVFPHMIYCVSLANKGESTCL